MKCERLIKLIKNWYLQVQDEAMAPARMVDFMRTHLADCPICRTDLGVDLEVKKIIEIILPPAKVAKAVHKEDTSGTDFEEFDAAGDDTESGDDDENGNSEVSGDGLEDEEIDDPEDDDI